MEPKKEMTVTEFASLGGYARAKKLGKAGLSAAMKRARQVRTDKQAAKKAKEEATLS